MSGDIVAQALLFTLRDEGFTVSPRRSCAPASHKYHAHTRARGKLPPVSRAPFSFFPSAIFISGIPLFHSSKYYYEYPFAPIRATIVRFYMTTHTTLSAATLTRRKSFPLATHHSPLITAFPIANARLEFQPSLRKRSLRPASNRKWTQVLRAPWRIAIFRACNRRPHAVPRISRVMDRESPVTAFLIYCGAIRIPRKPLKT